jgi:hypothetical protein
LITNDANALVLQSVINVTLSQINILSLSNSSGEFFRKQLTDFIDVNAAKKVFTFFISENEGNGNIVSVGLHGNGATTALNSGTKYASQPLALTKNNTQSLTIDWTVEVK